MHPRALATWAVLQSTAWLGAQAAASPPTPGDRAAAVAFARAPWHRTLADGCEAAKRTERLILAVATQTHAPCAACDALQSGLLLSEPFAALAKQVELVLMVHARPEDAAAAPDGLRTCPSLALLDASGKVVAKIGADTPASALADLHATAVAYVDFAAALRARGEPASRAEQVELFLWEVELRQHDYVELDKRLQALQPALTREQAARVAPHHAQAEIEWLATQTDMPAKELAARYAKLWRARRVPSGGAGLRFWLAYGAAASAAEDVVALDVAAESLEGISGAPAATIKALRERAEALRRR